MTEPLIAVFHHVQFLPGRAKLPQLTQKRWLLSALTNGMMCDPGSRKDLDSQDPSTLSLNGSPFL